MCRSIGHRSGMATAFGHLGDLYFAEGNHEEARQLYQNGLEISQEIGDSRGISQSLLNLGAAYRALDRTAEAYASYQESLRIAREIQLTDLIEQARQALSRF